MGRFLLARLAWTVPILFVILIVNFLIIHLAPGDPVQALVGDFPAPPGYLEQIRHDFGLDQPLWVNCCATGRTCCRGTSAIRSPTGSRCSSSSSRAPARRSS